MAIRMRRGNYADLDSTKLVEGEFAVCLDNGYVFVKCGTAGVVQLGTADTIEEALEQAQQYVSDAQGYAGDAEDSASAASTSATTSSNKSLDAEAWAKGTRNGVDVPSTDPTYHNNAKYYAEEAAVGDVPIATPSSLGVVKPDGSTITVENDGTIHSTASGIPTGGTTGQVLAKHSNTDRDVEWKTPFSGSYNDLSNKPTIPTNVSDLSDTAISSPTNGQGLIYDSTSQKWKNGTVSGGGGDWSDITNKPFNSVDTENFKITNGVMSNQIPTVYREVSADSWSGSEQTADYPVVVPDGYLSSGRPFNLILRNIGTTKVWKTAYNSSNNFYVREESSNTVVACKVNAASANWTGASNSAFSFRINLEYAHGDYYGGYVELQYRPQRTTTKIFVCTSNPAFKVYDASSFLEVKYFNSVSDSGQSINLNAGQQYLLLTREYNTSSGALVGFHAYHIAVPESDASALTPQGKNLSSTSPSGVSITYGVDGDGDPIVTVAASSAGYTVDFTIYAIAQ